jgi:thiamine biosynthesis lipoprotein
MPTLLLLVFSALLFAQEEMITRTQVLMGTYVSITLEAKENAQIAHAFEHIKQIEASLSNYDSNASLSKLNATHRIKYDPILSEALKLSTTYYKETNGYFDVTIGAISKELYHFGEETLRSPSKEALKAARLDIHGIHINDKTINTEANISIDLGGMGKGYATDKVATFLGRQNIRKGIIALSGDIRCLDLCEIELQSPYSEQTFATVQSKHPNLSVSTSGTYRRYATTKAEHHLINPKTAEQGREFVSVSLFTTANNATIDAYATAISVMPREQALCFLGQHKEIGFVLVDKNAEVLYGNTKNLIDIVWLDYKETLSKPSSTANTKRNPSNAKSFIHPNTTHPRVIIK